METNTTVLDAPKETKDTPASTENTTPAPVLEPVVQPQPVQPEPPKGITPNPTEKPSDFLPGRPTRRGRGRPPLSEAEKARRKAEKEKAEREKAEAQPAGTKDEPKKRGRKPKVRYQEPVRGRRDKIVLRIPYGEEVRERDFERQDKRMKEIKLYNLYPRLCDYDASLASGRGVNPREHNDTILSSPVSKDIQKALVENSDFFGLNNRGITILAEEVTVVKNKHVMITLSDWETHGVADGASTNYLIMRLQQEFLDGRKFDEVPKTEWPDHLRNAEVHLEILVNFNDRDALAEFVQARNTSRQVQQVSLSNFRGNYDWLKTVLDKSDFGEKIGYTENTDKAVDILDVVSDITVFHPALDSETETFNPAVAYASRARVDNMFVDERWASGYRKLSPIIPDILKLKETIYASFPQAYEKANPDPRLARRKGFTAKKHALPLTGLEAQYKVPNAYTVVLLSAFRSLVDFNGSHAKWAVDPFEFWNKHGAKLLKELLQHAKAAANTPNNLGKSDIAYSAMHKESLLILEKEYRKK